MQCFMSNPVMNSLQTCIYKYNISPILKKILKRTIDALDTIPFSPFYQTNRIHLLSAFNSTKQPHTPNLLDAL